MDGYDYLAAFLIFFLFFIYIVWFGSCSKTAFFRNLRISLRYYRGILKINFKMWNYNRVNWHNVQSKRLLNDALFVKHMRNLHKLFANVHMNNLRTLGIKEFKNFH